MHQGTDAGEHGWGDAVFFEDWKILLADEVMTESAKFSGNLAALFEIEAPAENAPADTLLQSSRAGLGCSLCAHSQSCCGGCTGHQ